MMRLIYAAAIAGICALVAVGCGASARAPLTTVRVRADTSPELAALLRRPLRVPRRCKLTAPVYLKKYGWTVGRVPLRAIIGDASRDTARESFTPARGRLHGWWYAKVIWLEPSFKYHGWLLIRGIGLDGSRAGFLSPNDRAQTALEFHARRTSAYPPPGQSDLAWSSAALLPHLGCYAYQVDGDSFSYSIIVRAYRGRTA